MNWIERQRKDQFVKKRKAMGLLSRSYFKIKEINEKFRFLKSEMSVLDLGSAPGGWAQYLLEQNCKVTCVDILPMTLKGVQFIHSDFRDITFDLTFDIILSDISPNISGNNAVDYSKMQSIVNDYKSLLKYLKKNTYFVFKSWTGIKIPFKKVKFYKPISSRKESKETFVIAEVGFEPDGF